LKDNVKMLKVVKIQAPGAEGFSRIHASSKEQAAE
jgi:hypothetical protein